MSEEKKLTDEELKQAFFILRHGSDEGLSAYIKAVLVIEEAYNNQKAEIERLEKDVHDMSWIIKIHKYCVGADHCQNSSTREFKLQNQLDELTEELDYYKCANRELTSTNEMLKRIAKGEK